MKLLNIFMSICNSMISLPYVILSDQICSWAKWPQCRPPGKVCAHFWRNICLTCISYVFLTGKKRENENLIFFEKRLQFEQGTRERENKLEERRISLEEKRLILEEKRLALDRDKLEQQVREWEEEKEERAQERAERERDRAQERHFFLTQQQAMLELVQSMIANKFK